MRTYIALLKGINVGGNKIIKMDDLKCLLTNIGFKHVQTYIQSGNIIFNVELTMPSELERTIETSIKTAFGFDVAVFVDEYAVFQNRVDKNIFSVKSEEEAKQVYITFLSGIPSKEAVEKLQNINTVQDTFMIFENTMFIKLKTKYNETVLSNPFVEKTLKVKATTRNWKTTQEIIKLASETALAS